MIVNDLNGSSTVFPDMLDEYSNYNSFIIFRQKNNNFRFFIFCPFNKKITASLIDGSLLVCGDELSLYPKLVYDCKYKDCWEFYGLYENGYKISSDYFIYAVSEDLLEYADIFNMNGFEFDWSDYSSVMVSSLKDVDMTSDAVLGELFGVLPILLVVLVSFIGIRKGISYLFSLLKKS